jgi:zinc protease
MVAPAEKEPVTAYEEKAVAAALMDAPPAAGKIAEEKENKELGYTELLLSNQVRVILKPTDFKNDQVVMSATRPGGQSLYDMKDKFNAAYATTVVSQMGVKDFSPVDLRKIFAGKTVNGSPRFAITSEGFGGQSGSADVETLLQLTHLYFTKPRKDVDLFSSFVTKQQAFLQNMMANPQTAYQDSVQKILYNNHPRGPRFPKVEDFGNIDLDRSLEIYKERFGNANGFTFIFVGSFDLAKMKQLAATYLGSLPSASAIAGYKDLGVRPIKGVVKKEVRKGTEPKSFISLIFTGETKYTDEANLRLQALIEVLNIKLIETLREELSGVYGAGASGQMGKVPYESYSINISMPCGPENVDKLIKATFDEIQKLQQAGPQEADLSKVKETWIKKYREDLKDNNYWLSKLQQTVDLGIAPGSILTGEQRVNALTTQQLKETANQLFNLNNYVQVVLYPEK